jgi:imidazolonepropionase-like amidohydrolase
MMKLFTSTLAFLALLTSFGQTGKMDLVIKNANLFDSRTGVLSANQTILVKDGIITQVTSNKKNYAATKTIDAKGKLVTPGFIDTHIHLTDVYRSYGALPESFAKDSLELYRKRLSDTYLPYGVTAAMIMGQSEKWLPPVLGWQMNPRPEYIDVYTVGGALISNEGRKPYINHSIVESPSAAKEKVIDYYGLGLRHIKLYWKLRRPEFEAAFKTADSLGMKVYGHVDQNIMFIDSTLAIGLRNYEHILTLATSVLHLQTEDKDFNSEMQKYYSPGTIKLPIGKFVERLEMFRFIHDRKGAAMDALINKLANSKTTFSTGFHLIAEQFAGFTYFTNNTQTDTSLTPEQVARCKENFKLLMGYVKQLFDKGIVLRIGTDWPSGGKAFISEQLLLAEYGFTIHDILQISTINGATALGLDDRYGAIEKGKKADLLIWDKSPFDDYKNFRASKTIIKDGIVFPIPNIIY